MKSSRLKIAVVGAGIVGASIAYHLARRGAAVTLLDRGQAGAGVTSQAFAWINVSHGLPEPYWALRQHAIGEYRRLEEALGPALRVDWCGALSWSADPAATAGLVAAHRAQGYDLRLVGRDEIAALEPNLLAPPAQAAYAPGEGAIAPLAVTQTLVRAAQQAGAEIRLATAVTAFTTNDRRLTGVATAAGTLAADRMILAAGTGAGELCAPLGLTLPLGSSPAILLRLRAAGSLIKTIVSNPRMEIRQLSESHLLAAEDYIDDTAANGPEAVAGRALAAIRAQLRGAETLALESVSVGLRPMPADGFPIIGFTQRAAGLYLAVMHAGITLAPAIGRFAAVEILDGQEQPLLQSCRPGRFAAPRSDPR